MKLKKPEEASSKRRHSDASKATIPGVTTPTSKPQVRRSSSVLTHVLLNFVLSLQLQVAEQRSRRSGSIAPMPTFDKHVMPQGGITTGGHGVAQTPHGSPMLVILSPHERPETKDNPLGSSGGTKPRLNSSGGNQAPPAGTDVTLSVSWRRSFES